MNEIHFRHIAKGWGQLLRQTGRNVMPLFVVFTAIQVAATAAVLIAVPADAQLRDLVELLQGRYPAWLPVAVITMVVMQVVGGTIHAATRRVVIDDVPMSLGDAFKTSIIRAPSMFGYFIVSSLIISFFVLLMVAIGLQILVVPIMLLGFVLEPGKWLVAARDFSVFEALRETVDWARRHWLWIVGVQAGVSLVTSAVTAGLEIDTSVPLTIVAFVTAHMSVRFLEWSVGSGLFIALDRAEFS